MDFSNISPELRERAETCKNVEELKALAEEEGIELSDEQFEAFSGGRPSFSSVAARRTGKS